MGHADDQDRLALEPRRADGPAAAVDGAIERAAEIDAKILFTAAVVVCATEAAKVADNHDTAVRAVVVVDGVPVVTLLAIVAYAVTTGGCSAIQPTGVGLTVGVQVTLITLFAILHDPVTAIGLDVSIRVGVGVGVGVRVGIHVAVCVGIAIRIYVGVHVGITVDITVADRSDVVVRRKNHGARRQ